MSKNIRLAYDDELLARMASARASSSSCPNICFFSSSRSGIASTDKPRGVHRLGEVSFGRNPARHNTGELVRQRGKVLRHVIDSGVTLHFGEVIDPYLRTVCGEHQRDAPSERTGTDDGHRPAREVGWYVETHFFLLIVLRGPGR